PDGAGGRCHCHVLSSRSGGAGELPAARHSIERGSHTPLPQYLQMSFGCMTLVSRQLYEIFCDCLELTRNVRKLAPSVPRRYILFLSATSRSGSRSATRRIGGRPWLRGRA